MIDRTWLLRHNLCRNIRAPKLNKVSGLGSVKINVTVFFFVVMYSLVVVSLVERIFM